MVTKTKGYTGWHLATSQSTNITPDFIGFTYQVKASIETLALRGVIPYRVADYLIRWGGMRND